ncbi:RNA-directed RNA polymerase [ssRNA phage SRR6254351_1]|uniref:RNA-directed RNA polymerase n=1 Tax=ssRNA phage SRR6254351_1 TaxID=2786492 RepID=A0A8S5L540_9VIRU|nr:RNA-directed RNA polymerase [ssRNA phage SRR6254351_1]DAD52540.1 TPA_asm: RNA-directed RNA polymerase [ssRNA phage SRR6254351_1]
MTKKKMYRGDKPFDIRIPAEVSQAFKRDLCTLTINREDGYETFKEAWLASNLLDKYVGKDTAPASVRRASAIEKWLGQEGRNRVTNARLLHAAAADVDLGWITYNELIARARQIIRRILGPCPNAYGLEPVAPTNGASTRVSRHENAAALKLEGDAHLTLQAAPHWAACSYRNMLSAQNVQFVESSVLFTVPKRSDIDRVACKEPEINMLLQRTYGVYIRDRLRQKAGINLRKQEVNQSYARDGSITGKLATVDLSSASDSITRMLVLQLLPSDWWSVLDDLRVKSTVIPKYARGVQRRVHELEMFSSMGNGFTFELESLLFYAITKVIVDEWAADRIDQGWAVDNRDTVVKVYGDDIIAPSAVIPRLFRVFSYVGFRVNMDKTFYTGRFRESCGKHYYHGRDVSPFFLRKDVDTMPELINILNQVGEWASRDVGFIENPEYLAFHYRYSQYVPPYLWGGTDFQDNTALVTGHAPRKRLKPVFKDMARPEDGAYCLWHVTANMVGVDADRNPFDVDPRRVIGHFVRGRSRGWTAPRRVWLMLTEAEATLS